MFRSAPPLARAGLLAAAALLAAGPAPAQTDPEARRLIEALRPSSSMVERGIRMLPPGAQPAPTSPAVSLTVTFATASAELTPEAQAALDPLGRALASPDLAPFRFRIEGHTDTVGDADANQRLSERRAAAVRGYLVSRHDVPAARLDTVGLGETRPAVQTGDNVAEPRNRRVQVVNLVQ